MTLVVIRVSQPGEPAAPAEQSVTYACTGSAPSGVQITYGPAGSQFSADSLPFSETDSLDASAQFYVTTAQLQGSGSVSCTTTVQPGGGGVVVAGGSASGGYNIASAQVCSSSDGWEKC